MPSDASIATDAFAPYVNGLRHLLKAQGEQRHIDLALDGGAAAAFRASVSLDDRRAAGAFFTSRKLAEHLIQPKDLAQAHTQVADPACGAGDLLLAVARLLPRGESALETLGLWGGRLIGRDLDPTLVRATQLRLALLAARLSGGSLSATDAEIAKALPEIRVGDGLEIELSEPVLLLLNPPFGVIRADTDWSSGRTPRAAMFLARLLKSLPEQSTVRAILPDVLRSGAHSQAWRHHIEELVAEAELEIWGRFDPSTDVDVFLLRAVRRDSSESIDWRYPQVPSDRVDHSFVVSVGPVVPHRDSEDGAESPYVCARDLPQGGEYWAGAKRRRHPGKRFIAPFVAIRRTSRPADGGRRIVATIVRSAEPVLVENHLIVCRPRDRRIATCESLAINLESAETSENLDQRIRCRHLTVGAVKELPFSPDQ